MKTIKSWFYKKIEKSLERKRIVRWFDCSCGKKFSVTTNIYDRSDSGVGHCECWKCSVTIN